MLKKIEELRKRPKPVRDRYAFYGAGIATLLIAGVWSLSLPAHITETEKAFEAENDESGGFARAFGDVQDQLGAVLESVQDSLPEEIEVPDDTVGENGQIDIAAMFATSSASETAPTPTPPVVQIATTSAALEVASSSVNQ